MSEFETLLDFDPWASLPLPNRNDYSTLLVTTETDHDFYWVLDYNNNFGLALNLTDNLSNQLLEHIPNFDNINIIIPPDAKNILILLKNEELKKQFRLISVDIISKCKKIDPKNTTSIFETIISVLNRWKKMFKISKKSTLSKEVRMGLLGELIFLKNILAKNLNIRLAIDAWQGPKGHEQDFTCNGHLFEIKTQLSSSDKIIKIASLEQLDTVSGQIWLYHLGLSPGENENNTISLQIIISQILQEIETDQFGSDYFLSNLELLGYDHDADYKHEPFVISFESFYAIKDDFPVIKRSMLNDAIVNSTYNINVNLLMVTD